MAQAARLERLRACSHVRSGESAEFTCTGVDRQRGGGDDLEAGRPQSTNELKRSEGDLDTCKHLRNQTTLLR